MKNMKNEMGREKNFTSRPGSAHRAARAPRQQLERFLEASARELSGCSSGAQSLSTKPNLKLPKLQSHIN